jgi:DNA replication and repair protein RecF
LRTQYLQINGYRNIPSLRLACPEELHLFIGSNAQGKTNIIESLYVLSFGKSHRTNKPKDLIQFGNVMADLKAQVKQKNQTLHLEVHLSEKGKKICCNGIEKPRLSQYIGSFPVVLFSPEDLAIVKGSPQVRRRFLDMEIGQASPTYIHYLSQLNKCIIQRNHLLKQWMQKRHGHDSLLDVLDKQFAHVAAKIWKKRFGFIKKLVPLAKRVHHNITQGKEELAIQYVPTIKIHPEMDFKQIEDYLMIDLNRVRTQEISRGITLLGPHRDDLRFFVDQHDLHSFGSQGQQRTAVLSLKLAELELLQQEMGFYPVLLLDDVLSELDDVRKLHLLESVRGRAQTFVTTATTEGISSQTLQRARIYKVQEGRISN